MQLLAMFDIWDRVELTSTIQSHASCTRHIMVLQSSLLDQLLCHSITGREQHSRGDTLCENWALAQLHLVPRSRSAFNVLFELQYSMPIDKC